MDIFYILLVLLILTRLFGEAAERVGQPALLGELVSGIVLGQVAFHWSGTFPVLAGLTENEVFTAITDLGIFFLMLLGGMELRPRKLAGTSKPALAVALGGMLLPLGLGLLLGWQFLPESEYRFAQALFVGTALAITAVPVAIKVLLDLGQLESRAGQAIVSAAVIDDILSLVLLAVLTAILRTGSAPGPQELLLLGGKVVLFFALTVSVGRWIFPRLARWVDRTHADEFEFSLLLVMALAFAVLAEVLGMHFILGAFMAGLFYGRRTVDEDTYEAVEGRTRGLTTGLFAPIFFASIGLHLDLSALVTIPGAVVGLVVVASLGKFLGAGLAALPFDFTPREALGVGAAMNARGAVELIVADIALRAGLFSVPDPTPPLVANLFSAVVIMAVVTTLMAPAVLKLTLRE